LGLTWVIATALASGFQVARNGLQRTLMAQTGPWGATLVRFLFGLPFSAAFAVLVTASTPGARPGFGEAFWFLAVLGAARQSWSAGLCGSLASIGWFAALALAPAASVRAVGVIEAPMAAFAGHRLFRERLHALQLFAGAGVAVGVLLTAVG
jgi:drug/metabolite transporter (DMT)-like permease